MKQAIEPKQPHRLEDRSINNPEIQKVIINMIQNRTGDIEYYCNIDDGYPTWLEPYTSLFTVKQSKFVEKGKGYFLDTGKITFRVEPGMELIKD